MSDIESDVAHVKQRLDKLEAQMSFLLRRLNIGAEERPDWDASPAVVDLLRQGDRKGAIRAFMDETSCSLNDARRYVDSLQV